MLLIASPVTSRVRWPWGGMPPTNPEETFRCCKLGCEGVSAHVCCYRQVRKRRYKARELAAEGMFPSCSKNCPQGQAVRAAMPKGYDPMTYQDGHRLKRPWKPHGTFRIPGAMPYLPDFRFGDDAVPDPETGYRRLGRGSPEKITETCLCCGHNSIFHRGAYGGECVITDCDCPGFDGKF